MTIIGFTGYARSGKDTAAAFLVDRGFKRLAFADALKESLYRLNPVISTHGFRVQDVVDRLGWDQVKVDYPEVRSLLQRFGTEVGRDLYGEQFWVDRVVSQIVPGQDYVITDVRFHNEVQAIRNLGGVVVRISRAGVQAVNSHVSDSGVDGLIVDSVIVNDGSLSDLREAVLDLVGI